MIRASRLVRLAAVVDQLADRVETAGLSRRERNAARREALSLIELLAGRSTEDARVLTRSLSMLADALARPVSRDGLVNPESRRRFRRVLRRVVAILAAASVTAALPAAAGGAAPPPMIRALAVPAMAVGDSILNPLTGSNEEIVQILGDGAVLTDQGNAIILATAVGDVFSVEDEHGNFETYTVTGVTTDLDGHVVGIDVIDGSSTPSTLNVVTDVNAYLDGVPDFPNGDDGTGSGDVDFPSAAGDVNNYVQSRRGSGGSNGRDGAGVKVCVPFVGCARVGKEPTSGGNGANGPTVTADVAPGVITTVSDSLPGVVVSSVGGNGGDGGDAYGNFSGARGGRAGHGGNVTLNMAATVSTSGDSSHGVFAQSRSGRGGQGGTGYIAGSGGGGGNPGQGGSVTVNITGAISTIGDDAMGVLAQSLGGAAGTGGDSFGIIGDGGGGSSGGNGGAVSVNQGGVIQTSGARSHGVLAQSIGGSGGRAGDSGGLATFGDDGGAGGDGGAVRITAQSGSRTITTGDGAFALFGQSVGGGGGDGGSATGGWVMGSGGAAGGAGGQVEIVLESGAVASTSGADAYGVFAQSIGGGGGSGGATSGAVSLGASGDAGGGADDVTITSAGQVSTEGENARGLFAQSVGGGGGASRRASGAVSIGGSGGAGGAGGEVRIDVLAGGSVSTQGDNADAVFAQSVGGGGGSAQGATGVVSLGGSGGAGGDGGTVTASNAGFIQTTGAHARGIFAQSVGGGGGAGGGAGGLAALGGSGGGASDGGRVTVANTGVISTFGALSSAIHAQSVGGGGGDGGASLGMGVTLGGAGGGGGGGGVVTVEHGGQLFTQGDDSHGLFAQSVGGGGGSGGAARSFSVFGGLSLGGAGGDGGDGGQVDVVFSPRTVTLPGGTVEAPASIVTTGDRSRGLFAQSVGGGGGSGGWAAQVTAGYSLGAATAIGGAGGDGGQGGRVTLTGDADIATAGDNAEGIYAQSVGGGGGAGGFAISFAFAAGDAVAGAFGTSVGGAGGDGGQGGVVSIESGGSIHTEGQFSTGLFAQSVGGGGGAGGFAVALSGSGAGGAAGAVSVSVGGSGGGGGDGGTVDARFDGAATTLGDDAAGAVIQSVGGGGGRGGFAVAGAVAGGGSAGAGVSVGVGGSGGSGGRGGAVSGHVGGAVHTEGDRSTGVIIQSQGGGGGVGGFAVAGSLGAGGSGSGAVSVGIGGAGGDGGDGGDVDASAGSITTLGDQSGGFLAQSTGGGGGLGGFVVTSGLSLSGGTSGAAGVGVGGMGGGGGHGGDVTAALTGDVTTLGDQSNAVTAQSTGGGGGTGGFAAVGNLAASKATAGAVSVGVGGAGGDGGDGGEVTLDVTGLTQTAGADSVAILAQSSGGGGGSGAFAIAGGMSIAAGAGGTAGAGVGGLGGGGGDGGDVILTVNEGVDDADDTLIAAVTIGDGARAIVAQSEGGGGGHGGFSVTAGLSVAKGAAGNAGVGIGGGGGDGGDGGAVSAHVTGDVMTAGAGASAVLVQSGGGGGGAGGFNVVGGVSISTIGSGNLLAGVGGYGGAGGAGGAVTGVVDGDILTLGDDAFGVTYQSTGGGGGAGAFNVTGGLSLGLSGASGAGVLAVGVGGMGGGGGGGGRVNAEVIGDIRTEGDRAYGALFQSEGGGGGFGGFNVSGGISVASGAAGVLGIGVGGFGGDGGDGGAVTGRLTGDIATQGQDSFGALFQSVGGGGGAGGFNITGGISLSSSTGGAGAVGVGVGGFGGAGGDGDDVDAAVIGDITTLGDGAFGLTIESTGGGGGAGGFNITGDIGVTLGEGASAAAGFGIGGFGGAGGEGGDVTGAATGDITTAGHGAHGVLIQSSGGGGGSGGFNVTGSLNVSTGAGGAVGIGVGGFGGAGGDGGDVDGHLIGNVGTLGDDAFGALLQSTGAGGGSGALNVTGGVSITTRNHPAVAAGVGVGGFGGDGGDAGNVSGVVIGDYITHGALADGVVTQSVGGGGGRGGVNVASALELGMGVGGSASVGLGGFGGGGGDGGGVDLTRVGDTVTHGANSDGVVVQSTGGGGGRGRVNVSGSIVASMGDSRGLALGVGGFGGDGGDGGSVSAHITGNVLALGQGSDETDGGRHRRLNGSNGVVVQSVGGGGGGGGINVSGSLAVDGALSLGLGGFGGLGGDAGRVQLTINAPGADRVQVAATGDERAAVIAQSIGGGGGHGGVNISGSLALDKTATLGVGGFGGGGGSASDVNLIVDADLFAAGAHTRGLVAQSIGGGGGDGGINISGGVSARSGAAAPTLVFGVGGWGGDGGPSGDVDTRHHGNIQVEGAQAIGALIQSVAGGGGGGALNVSGLLSLAGTSGFSLGVGVGGAGGDADDAGDVRLDSVGHVIVQGDPNAPRTDPDDENFDPAAFLGRSAGIIVQSIGGGGGVGGVSATGVITPSGSPLAIGVGGSGGSGGDGGAVSVRRGYVDVGGVEIEAAGLIHTNENRSAGLYVQSVGGGGGLAGVNVVGGLTLAGTVAQPLSMLMAIGGSGGGSGLGGAVDVRHRGDIVTEGNRSIGLFAQSVGGGGGDANVNLGLGWLSGASSANVSIGGRLDAGGDAGAVTVEHDGLISTTGHHSSAVTAQSLGGGGGNAGLDLALGMGTDNNIRIGMGQIGGSGGIGGDVSTTVRGFLDTAGDDSDGVFAQSVGGGGGRSGSLSAGGQITDGAVEYDYSLAIGLEGGDGAVGGRVMVNTDGDIVTRGDRSRGVFAQSLGGGGGVGGGAFAGFLAFSGSANWGGMAVGGSGGLGSIGGDVAVSNAARIITLGRKSDGVLAQSIGGGGGLGGQAIAASLELGGATPGSPSSSGVIVVGGTGGSGAAGGDVTVANTGVIATAGDQSFGIRAQSIGGGGGIGGAVMNFQFQGARVSQDLSINVGGSGGDGGVGGEVFVTNQGLILTEGTEASAIAAHSIGGGGGDAGIILQMDVSAGQSESPGLDQLNINVGGFGGVGGAGGDVTVINAAEGDADPARLVTFGDRAHGVLAQSIGGGGGNGSSILSFTASGGGKISTAASLNIGGSGGAGERGGKVTVRNTGEIDTSGEGAHGVLAQSIGGGGGNAGLVLSGHAAITSSAGSPLISLGGFGGDGGDSGAVRIDNSGRIITRGARSHGVVAQSIGGGGGDGQINLGLTGGLSSLAISEGLNAVIGGAFGFGGAGGQGGTVTVNHSGDITVLGDGSMAIKAESINGGGGSLVMDFDGVVGMPGVPVIGANGEPERADPLLAARLGGANQSDMNAGRVTVNTTGVFGAAGDHGAGDFTSSTGGGGGSLILHARLTDDADQNAADNPSPLHVAAALGGLNGVSNAGGDIHGVHAGDITTTGRDTPGVLTQSVGGGGGRAVVWIEASEAGLVGDVNVTLGGENGVGETGGDVTREHVGAVVSTGDIAPGVILQSIGGGGGSASVTLDGDEATHTGVMVALGARGGAGLDGGAVIGLFNGEMRTFGDFSPAIVLQSIGAGGGEARIAGGVDADVRLGADGGADGDGGDVTLINNGDIVTEGTQAHGVFLQSVGGGGGAVFGGAGTVELSDANSGDGGEIILRQTGGIVARGAGAHGVIAQSVGGGGGWVDGLFAGRAGGLGAGGGIDLILSGDVLALGDGSVAILAQSAGSSSGGIAISTDGLVRGNATGIRIDGGADNELIISGSVSAISGQAIEGMFGNDRVLNHGLVVGDVDLGGGDNAFVNDQGAVFVTHGVVDLGGGAFTNAGDLLMGLSAPRLPLDLAAGETFGDLDDQGDPSFNLFYGARVISTVELNGDFVQTANGHMVFDVAFGPYASDRVNVTGDAVVNGAGDITLTWLENANPVTLFATGGAGIDQGLEITDTLAMDYHLLADDDGVHLAFTSDFGQPFLNVNGQALGRHIDSALMAGGSSRIGRLAARLGNLRAGEETLYAAAFAQLDPEPHTAPLQEQFASAQAFAGSLFGCVPPGSRSEEACGWAVVQSGVSESAGDARTYAAESRFTRLTTGFQRPLDDRWSISGALGYDRLNALDIDGTRAHMSGQGLNLGLGVQYAVPDSGLQFGAFASGGWSWLDSLRRMDLFATGIGESEPRVGHAMVGGHAAWLGRHGRLFVRPALNLSATALRHDGFVEAGLEGLGARAEGDTQWFGTLNPELTVGLVIQQNPFSHTTLSLNVGVVHHTTDHVDLPIRFVGASDASEPALMITPLDRSEYRVGAELMIAGDERLSVRFSYDARFGDRTDRQTAGLSVKLRF